MSHLFCFSLQLKITQIFAFEFFQVFSTVHVYLITKYNLFLECIEESIKNSNLLKFEILPISIGFYVEAC
jgi:hypothetical protein